MRISDWSSDVCSSDLVSLVDWDDRPGPDNTADAIAQRARGALSGLRDAQIFALVPGAVRGLGDTSGFTMEFQNRSGMSRDEFAAARDRLLAMANASPKLTSVRLGHLPDRRTLTGDIDRNGRTATGLSTNDMQK